MPGIEVRAPLRQLSNSGFSASPNFMPIAASVFCQGGGHFVAERLRELPPFGEKDRAELGADRESGGNRQVELGHLGQVRPLAAERVFHRRIAFGPLRAEEVNVLLSHFCLPSRDVTKKCAIVPFYSAATYPRLPRQPTIPSVHTASQERNRKVYQRGKRASRIVRGFGCDILLGGTYVPPMYKELPMSFCRIVALLARVLLARYSSQWCEPPAQLERHDQVHDRQGHGVGEHPGSLGRGLRPRDACRHVTFLLLGGLSVLLGFCPRRRRAADPLLIPVTLIFHDFWTRASPALSQMINS